MKECIVIGGGAAGMMAALFAARAGASVALLERNEKLGKKVYITGKGRCNLTNTASKEDFMRQIPRNSRFLYTALSFLSNDDLMELMRGLGLELKTERGGRVFPASDHASDVTRTLENELRRLGVRLLFDARVQRVDLAGNRVQAVQLEDGRVLPADAVIVATGGLSYPSTGSTGDGYDFARSAGLGVTDTRPALTSIETEEDWPGAISGLTLKNVALNCVEGKKKLFGEQGELLFTHFGLSGPLALSLSSALPDDGCGRRVTIDLKPALSAQALDQRLLRDFKAQSRKQILSVMDGLEPHNLGVELLKCAGIPAGQAVNAITQAQRAQLVALLKAVPLTIRSLRGYNEAVITRGGVEVKALNASTMAAKNVQGLYFAGEVVDVDAMTGGYNLQLAFSMGALAGARAAAWLQEQA